MELEEGMNIFNKCLQLLDASNTKRFSFDLEKSIKDFAEKDKANRTSTLTVWLGLSLLFNIVDSA